ncbi:MAG: RNA methyltransferase [Gemmataceae bacterium]
MRFILVRPAYPSNMGATARALKTMGFSDLAFVAPLESPMNERAIKLARDSVDVLENATIYDTLAAALEDCDFVIGTTIQDRRPFPVKISSHDLNAYLEERESIIQRPALLFGTEKTGLVTEEIEFCDILCSIPTAGPHPSLNLAQAVMVFAYELSKQTSIVGSLPGSGSPQPPESVYKAFKESVDAIATEIGMKPEWSLYRKLITSLPYLKTEDLRWIFKVVSLLRGRLEGSAEGVDLSKRDDSTRSGSPPFSSK